MSTDTITRVSAEEYLARERAATNSRSEWVDGEIREMVGATHAHNVVCWNLLRIFGTLFEGQPFVAYPGDMKVRIPDGPYYYPDVMVAPDPPQFEDDRTDIVLDPRIVVEVLSPSTESVDRGEKLDNYRLLPSLADYLLVDQSRPRVDHYRREGGAWKLTITEDLAGTVAIPSVDGRLPLAQVYERVFRSEAGA